MSLKSLQINNQNGNIENEFLFFCLSSWLHPKTIFVHTCISEQYQNFFTGRYTADLSKTNKQNSAITGDFEADIFQVKHATDKYGVLSP